MFFGMFSQFARLGVTRAAAFFYAVAVGVAANIVIAHFSPHDDVVPVLPATWPTVAKPAEAPVASALIAPKPAVPAKALDISAPATAPTPPPSPPVAAPGINAATMPAMPAPILPPTDAPVVTALPNAPAMVPPPLKPVALPSMPPPVVPDAKPAPDKPAGNIEAAASSTSSAPISLLPQPDAPAADQPAPKPGPGSGGLY